MRLSPQLRSRLRRFRHIRRGWISLWILLAAYAVSLASPLFVGNRPIVLRYDGRWSFPALTRTYYSSKTFGSRIDIETDFRELKGKAAFKEHGGFLLMPPHPYSPLETIIVPGDPPPSYPSREHPMGTDDRGRDVLARLVSGFRISVSFALLVTGGSFVLGVTLGAVQGYFGGRLDLVGQRLTEIWVALPFLYVVTLVASVVTPTFPLLVTILVLFGWMGILQYTRGEVLRERNKDYVTAARAMGAGWPRALFGHVLGNSLTSAITLFPISLVSDIFALTALDFLGYGLPAPTPSWGELFSEGRTQITSWWLITFPFLALVTTLLLLTFIGEAVREAWDPREFRPPAAMDERPSFIARAVGRALGRVPGRGRRRAA
jgi:microcin C transport system permease protein